MNPNRGDGRLYDSQVEEDIDWREALFARVRVVLVVVMFFGGIATFVGFRSEAMRWLGAGLIAFSFLGTAVLWGSWTSPRVKRVIAIALMSIASIGAYTISGYLPGPALGVAFALVMSVLFFGRKTFAILLVIFSLYLIALLIAIATGVWQGPALIDITPSDATNWYRTTQITILLWASLGFSVSFVVTSIEENLARRRAALEQLRTEIAGREVAEEVATEAQKHEAVGQLAAGIAHDFNNALLVIQGWNEIRGLLDADERQREATDAIEKAANRTTQLARQLLTFARKDLRIPKYIYLDRLVAESGKTLQSLVGSRILIEINVESKQTVYADESQLQQILFNLVINSSHAITGDGIIRVSVKRATPAQIETLKLESYNWVVLEVEDNGCGIEKELQTSVFEPFFTTKEKGSGTGLGLSTVQGIVQRSGGRIDLSSRPGKTVFSILFPSVDGSPTGLDEEGGKHNKSIAGLRILIVEDDPAALQMLTTFLKAQDCLVTSCGHGDAAIALLERDPSTFDILCSDAIFPGADLETVISKFELHSPDGRVLICSGYSDEGAAVERIRAGDYAFLPKPFTGTQLARKIYELINTS